MENKYNFIGEYDHNIDSKGRMVLPSKYRPFLKDEKIYLITGIGEKCIYLLPQQEWKAVLDKFSNISLTDKTGQMFLRFLTSRAYETKMDKQGRIFIPNNLRKYADITKEVVVVGVINRFEIWNKDLWDKKNNSIDIEDMMQKLKEDYGI